MTTAEFVQQLKDGRLPQGSREFHGWSEDSQELQNWRKKLQEYEEALEALKSI